MFKLTGTFRVKFDSFDNHPEHIPRTNKLTRKSMTVIC